MKHKKMKELDARDWGEILLKPKGAAGLGYLFLAVLFALGPTYAIGLSFGLGFLFIVWSIKDFRKKGGSIYDGN